MWIYSPKRVSWGAFLIFPPGVLGFEANPAFIIRVPYSGLYLGVLIRGFTLPLLREGVQRDRVLTLGPLS